jgi:transcriptional regulator with XRE-family HTH domain
MIGQGRHPDGKRRRRVAELREQGLSFRAIARRFGVTPQATQQLFRSPPRPGLKCRGCGVLVAPDRDPSRFPGGVYCRECLGSKPRVAFAVRLRSLRAAAGLTQQQLAEKAGVALRTVSSLEQGVNESVLSTLLALGDALGVNCLAFTQADEGEEAMPQKQGRGRPRKAKAAEAEREPKKPRGRPRKGK